MRKTIAIIGATTGLGRAAARELARAHHVIACGRDVARVSAAVPAASEVMRVDLTDLADVLRFADQLLAPGTRIDALICNAGVQGHGAPARTRDGFEETFAVNHLAHFAIATRLAPQLGRVVFIGSGTHDPRDRLARLLFGFRGARYTTARALAAGDGDASVDDAQRARDRYATSKLCNLLTVEALARRGIDAVALDPGVMPGTQLARAYGPVARFAWHTVMRAVALVMPGASSVRRSARALAWIATAPALAHRYYDHRKRPLEAWEGARRSDWIEDLYATSSELVASSSPLASTSASSSSA